MMRLLRLHLASDEFDAADFYARQIKAVPDPQTAGVATALRVWIEQRRAQRARERGRMAAEFVSESRARLAALDLGKTKMPAAIALKHIVRSEIADSLGDKELARAELDAVPLDEVLLPSVLEAYYERADALYRELDDRDALVAAARKLAEHPALDGEARLRYARAAVRALVRGRATTKPTPCWRGPRRRRAPSWPSPSSSGAPSAPFAPRSRPRACARRWWRSIAGSSGMTGSAPSCSMPCSAPRRLEAEKLVEALAQLYVDDAPRGTQERRRAERLFERVMLSRAYRRLAKGHLDHARDTFLQVAETTGSLEAHVGYVDLRLGAGATPGELRAEYDRRSGDANAPVSLFVRAYLLARELPSLRGDAREQAIDGAIAGLRRAAPALRGKPEPQVVWGAVLHERYLDDGDARLGAEGEPALSVGARAGVAQSALSLAHPVGARAAAGRGGQLAHRARLPHGARQAAARRRRRWRSSIGWSRRARSCTSIARPRLPTPPTPRSPWSSARRRWRSCAPWSSIATRSTTSLPAAFAERSRSTMQLLPLARGDRNQLVARLATRGRGARCGGGAPRRRRSRHRRGRAG